MHLKPERRGMALGAAFTAMVLHAGVAWGALAPPASAGYVTPPLQSAASRQPVAFPPGSTSTFLKDLDLPEVDHYVSEVLRSVRGGFSSVTVVQFAVIRRGEPVQVMLVRASGHGHWTVTSRQFGELSWVQYETYRSHFFSDLAKQAADVGGGASPREVCTDDAGGMISFGSGGPPGLTASLNIGCGEDETGRSLGDEMLARAVQAVAGVGGR
ncbi:MAG: hypothetical protein WA840_17215 [Caulobacteraceae bacterium]